MSYIWVENTAIPGVAYRVRVPRRVELRVRQRQQERAAGDSYNAYWESLPRRERVKMLADFHNGTGIWSW